jgi:acyl-CoA thioester hydrolase
VPVRPPRRRNRLRRGDCHRRVQFAKNPNCCFVAYNPILMVRPMDPSLSIDATVRVRYKETDQMGIAHHANYLAWFEIGRTDLCRALGTSYREIEESGLLLVVTEIGCRYRIPFRYDDEVVIRTGVELASPRGMRFVYELHDSEGLICASGFSAHIWLDPETRRPIMAPRAVIERFTRFIAE